MKRALILVEGQTEKRFVEEVLAEHLMDLGLSIVPTLLVTKFVKNGPDFKGGVTSFVRFESDMRRLLGGAGMDAIVTTMIDYYRLPGNFPDMNTLPKITDVFGRVEHVGERLADTLQ